MNKFIFLLYTLLLTTPLHSMMKPKTLFTESNKLSQALRFTRMQTDESHNLHEDIKNADPRVKNHVLKTTVFKNYEQYRSKIERLVKVGADPNIIPDNGFIPLAVALDRDDIHFATLLLSCFANPNLFITHMPVDITGHQETGSCPNIHHFASKPAFYFAKNCEAAQLCLDYGAQPDLKYCNHAYKQTHDYGNVLTHIIDHDDYSADLIPLYLNAEKDAAGPYSTSYASYDGTSLHHTVHTSSIRPDDADRQLICAKYLLIHAPNLLTSKDQDGNTPGDCLNLLMKHKEQKEIHKKFAQLFDQHVTQANKSRE